MEPNIIFQPLKERKGLKIFLLSSLGIGFFYFAFLFLSAGKALNFPLFSLEIFTNAPFIVAKAFALYRTIDYIFLLLFPLTGGLLFANCNYWACEKKGAKNLGEMSLLLGLVTITCPACLLPLLGLASLIPFIFKFGSIIKGILIFLIIASIYLVAYRQQKSSCR